MENSNAYNGAFLAERTFVMDLRGRGSISKREQG
jgi:hypothetical protein